MKSADPYMQFGDVIEHRNWYTDWCHEHGSRRFPLLLAGRQIAPDVADRIVSVRFRPDGENYSSGHLTVFWAEPGQLRGPYPSRSVPLAGDKHFTESISDMIAA